MMLIKGNAEIEDADAVMYSEDTDEAERAEAAKIALAAINDILEKYGI